MDGTYICKDCGTTCKCEAPSSKFIPIALIVIGMLALMNPWYMSEELMIIFTHRDAPQDKILLGVCIIVVGIISLLYTIFNGKQKCSACGSVGLIPTDTPIGKGLAKTAKEKHD